MIRARALTDGAKKRLQDIAKHLTPEALDAVVDQAAFQTQAALIRATPKKWFGQVRRGWIVVNEGPGRRRVGNTNKIMLFLEEGTKAHGPKADLIGPLQPGRVKAIQRKIKGGSIRAVVNNQIQGRRKAALFIPLTRRAVNATAGTFFTGTVDQFTEKGESYWEQRAALFTQTESVSKGVRKTGLRGLVFGVDYVLAKWVKGIKALHITANERPRAQKRLRAGMVAYVKKIVEG